MDKYLRRKWRIYLGIEPGNVINANVVRGCSQMYQDDSQ
jgi:hypothetical protein